MDGLKYKLGTKLITLKNRALNRASTSKTSNLNLQKTINKAEDRIQKPIQIIPYKDNNGLESATSFYRSIHTLQKSILGRNKTSTNSFEIWYENGQLQFYIFPGNTRQREKISGLLPNQYPDSNLLVKEKVFPRISQDDYIAGASLKYRSDHWYPIKNPFTMRGGEPDPYASITSEIENLPREARIVIQVLWKPIGGAWTRRRVRFFTSYLRGVDYSVGDWAEDEESHLQKVMEKQTHGKNYHVNIRVLGIAPSSSLAKNAVLKVAEQFENSYDDSVTGQGLSVRLHGFPTKYRLSKIAKKSVLRKRVVRRKLFPSFRSPIRTKPNYFSCMELASVAHIPNAEIESSRIEWTTTRSAGEVPATADRIEDW